MVFLIRTVVVLAGLWAALACAFAYWPAFLPFAAGLAVLGLTLWVVRSPQKRHLIGFAATFAVVLVWFVTRSPVGNRDWDEAQERTPRAEIDGGTLTIRGVRNFDWRSAEDFEARWEDRTYDLDRLETLDFVVTYFSSLRRVAHTCLSFGFADGRYFNVSVEARRLKGEPFNPIAGLFKRYELIYTVVDERDAFASRALFFNERIYVYRTNSPPEKIRALLVDMLIRANHLADAPEFYDLLTQNCTTTIVDHINRVRPDIAPWDIRIWLNGDSDRLAYDRGWLDTSVPFDELRGRARADLKAREHYDAPDFSAQVRR